MNEWFGKWKTILKKKPPVEKKPLLIICIGVVGMLCLLFSGRETRTVKKESAADPAAVQEEVIKQLESLLKTVEGVGNVKVYVSIDRLEENIYAKNAEQSSETDRSEKIEKYVLTEQNNDTEGLVRYTVMPCIRGVAVSCEGGGSVTVRQEVTKLISAALGINANRIWVAKMQK